MFLKMYIFEKAKATICTNVYGSKIF